MTPAASWTFVAIVVGLPAFVLYCALRISDLAIRRAEAQSPPMNRHTCSICGRVQPWTRQYDQFSPCLVCQAFDQNRKIELDLDDFSNAEAIRVYLDGTEPLRPPSQEPM